MQMEMEQEELDSVSIAFTTLDSGSDETAVQQQKAAAGVSTITIPQEDYKRLKDAYKKLPDIMPREEIDRRVELERNSLTKARLQAEADAFRDSQKLSELEKKCQDYYTPSTIKDAGSVRETKLAFLEAMKRKYSVPKFRVDESGDLDSQIENLCLLVQEFTAYRQTVNTRNREVGKIINNTKAQRHKERWGAAAHV
ncbi:terminase [Borrelia sp. P9F1]|uniref:terminase n=1 Tax=Borrelia sp. P9F1 TaxID=3058374 RepID=UPI0026490186|nr:terminase [Borrelia sp. P9F1]WKC58528.1 terminase [Borrelia sp. P9F1]